MYHSFIISLYIKRDLRHFKCTHRHIMVCFWKNKARTLLFSCKSRYAVWNHFAPDVWNRFAPKWRYNSVDRYKWEIYNGMYNKNSCTNSFPTWVHITLMTIRAGTCIIIWGNADQYGRALYWPSQQPQNSENVSLGLRGTEMSSLLSLCPVLNCLLSALSCTKAAAKSMYSQEEGYLLPRLYL